MRLPSFGSAATADFNILLNNCAQQFLFLRYFKNTFYPESKK
jgi:hypothetical protein